MVESRETRLLRHAQFAVPTLEALLAAGHEIALVVSQPDRPVGRTSNSPLRPSSRPRWPPDSPSRSRKKSATTPNSAPSLRPSRPTPLSSSPMAASFRPGCWLCRGWAASTCTARCCPSTAAPRPSSGPWPWATPSPAIPPCCLKKASTPAPFCSSRPSRSRPIRPPSDLFDRARQGGRAAGG